MLVVSISSSLLSNAETKAAQAGWSISTNRSDGEGGRSGLPILEAAVVDAQSQTFPVAFSPIRIWTLTSILIPDA
jgi:hypothetical protein